MSWQRMLVATAAVLVAANTALVHAAEADATDPKVVAQLRAATDFLKQQAGFKVALATAMRIEAEGLKQEMSSDYSLAVERPNRLAMPLKRPELGTSIVCDGKQFYRDMGPTKQYVVTAAPARLAALFEAEDTALVGYNFGGIFLHAILSDNAVEQLLEGVEAASDAGAEKLDGRACRQLRFEQADLAWSLWFEEGDRPLVRKVVFEPVVPETEQNITRMSVTLVFSDWNLDPKFGDDEFAIRPPEGWTKVDSLFATPGEEAPEAPHPLTGQPAPDFELERLAGGKASLANHRGKEVVILDFWATWCGPCVRALPTIAKVARAYRDKGVAFYAVDLEEQPDEIREFLDEQKLDLPVVLDHDGAVARLYGVDSIPQTVLVGKDGKVQVVHVGLSGNLEERLSGELDDLLAGKDLAGEAAEARRKAQTPQGLEPAWTHAGNWIAAASDPQAGIAYALDWRGKLVSLNAKGELLGTATISQPGNALRTANLTGDAKRELLVFDVWGKSVDAYDAQGKPLWSYAKGQGIDDVCAADLDGDGMEEVVIGYNGSTGLHVLDHTGALVWKNTELGNVWHVAAGNLAGDARAEVVTTSAFGQLHFFDADGKHLNDLDPGFYANIVRVRPGDTPDAAATISAGRSDQSIEMGAFDGTGKRLWSQSVEAEVENGATSRSRLWLAVALRNGSVRVFDIPSGKPLAKVGGLGRRVDVTWLESGDGAPLLVVTGGGELHAYRVAEKTP